MSEDRKKPTKNASGAQSEITVVEASDRDVRQSLIIATGVLILFGIGFGTYFGVKHAMREVRSGELAAMRDAKVQGFEIWLEQRTASAGRWARLPAVQEDVLRALARNRANSGRPSSCDAVEAKRIAATLRPALFGRGFITYEILDRSGTIIASHVPEYCGRRVRTATFLARIEGTLAGRSVFVRPLAEADRMAPLDRPSAGAEKPRFTAPMVWFAVPVHAPDGGEVIATAVFGEPTTTRFATILGQHWLGETDEAYAFDDQGLMLTEVRHLEPIREAALLKDPTLPGATLNVELRDPGRDLLAGPGALEPVASWPRTTLVQRATAAKSGGTSGDKAGTLIVPYRNYRGVAVVGAWRWLDSVDMGVAMEMDDREVYAPLRTLDRAFALVLGIAVACSVGVLIMIVSALRERRQFGRVRRLGRYTLIRAIGEGGMASVFLGRHALLKRQIAVKILKRQASDESIRRFEREVQLASRLSHPNVVEIYDYGHTRSGEVYYVMEYVDGITLGELAAREGPLPVGRAIHLVRQICSALARAHHQGLVHRDIKPENIMVCMRGGEHDVIKILDFGLVKNLEGPQTRDITSAVVRVLGTPVYMAPERFVNPTDADVRSDIYAIGAVAYQLLSGRRLFDGLAGADLQFQIMHTPPLAPGEARGSPIPGALEAMILACLAKQPADRPQTVEDLLDRLRELALDHPWSNREAADWWRDHGKAQDAKGNAVPTP